MLSRCIILSKLRDYNRGIVGHHDMGWQFKTFARVSDRSTVIPIGVGHNPGRLNKNLTFPFLRILLTLVMEPRALKEPEIKKYTGLPVF